MIAVEAQCGVVDWDYGTAVAAIMENTTGMSLWPRRREALAVWHACLGC